MGMNFNLSYLRILVAAVVLGIIARTISPKSSEAAIRENTSQLIDALVAMRSNLDLYKAQHEGQLPPIDSFAEFEKAFTSDADYFGPYMERIPVNPFNNRNTVRFDGEPAGVNQAGWRLDTKTGKLQADNDPAYAKL
jgi:type II secretory pathway pseudopilin PulG